MNAFSHKFLGLPSTIRLRAEYFGGIVFDTSNGNLLEVDKDAFKLLSALKQQSIEYKDLQDLKLKKKSQKEIETFVHEMLDLKIIEEQGKREFYYLPDDLPRKEFKYAHLSAPETVHWAITFRCSKHCPDCYVKRHSDNFKEMDTNAAFKLIDKISDWNVFQLAIGGGEPFERKDLSEIVKYAHQKGLMVHVTTAQTIICSDLFKQLSSSLQSIQLGLNTDLLLENSAAYLKEICEFRKKSEGAKLRTGVNLILDRQSLFQINRIIQQITDCGFKRIVLLRYKPPEKIQRWEEHKPQNEQLIKLHQEIADIQKRYPEVSFRFDCALSFLQRNLTEKEAAKHGFKGCVAADRILSVAPDGNVYPCSQLVHESFCGGNLLEEKPDEIWNHSKRIKKYRNFRKKGEFVKSSCGICLAKNFCGGCRVFAEDGFCEDPGCPEPLHRPLTELGKTGRQVDFVNYLKECSEISVADYMERYGVGQKTAVSELRNSQISHCLTGKGRKIKDIYQDLLEDTIWDIQQSIGNTNAGFPYASYDEIAEWIEEKDNEDYPKWLNNFEWRQIDEINFS